MSYDDPHPYHQPVVICFTTLEADHCPDFALTKTSTLLIESLSFSNG
jgi:hypothetical protein